MRKSLFLAGVLVSASWAALPALAEASGAVLAAPCASCHGTGGRSPGSIPSIDGMGAAEFAQKFIGFRSGEIAATVMGRIARGYTDAEVAALVAYFTAGRP